MDLINFIKENVILEVLFKVFSILITFDVITGVIKAWKNGRFKSKTLRNGLFESLGEVMLLALCVSGSYLIPVVRTIVYILILFMVIKELESIKENLLQIGVKFPTWLVKGLEVYSDKLDKME